MFTTYNLFNHRDINDLIPEIVYLYLFKGYGLAEIEKTLFHTEDYHGWLSKTFLNYYGIDTSRSEDNKGLYTDRTISDVVDELSRSTDIVHLRIAKILRCKYL